MSALKEIEKIIFNTGISFERALIKYKINGGGEPIPPVVEPIKWGDLKITTWGNLKTKNITWKMLKEGVEL